MLKREDIKIASCEARGFYAYHVHKGVQYAIAYTRTLEEAEQCISRYLADSHRNKW